MITLERLLTNFEDNNVAINYASQWELMPRPVSGYFSIDALQ